MNLDRQPVDTSLDRREASVQNRIDELRRQLEQRRARRAERTAFFNGMARARQHLMLDSMTPVLLTGSMSE